MRILVVSNLYPPVQVGGYERRCADTVRWLAREHEVLVITSRRGRRAAKKVFQNDGTPGYVPGRGAGSPRDVSHVPPACASTPRGAQLDPGTPRTHPHFERPSSADGYVLRELPLLPDDWRGTACAPLASLYAARVTRRLARRYRPDLIFVWNASQIPHAAICAAHDCGGWLAFSVADSSFGTFVEGDQFLRYLVGRQRGVHRVWGSIVKLMNRLPSLRIEPRAVRPASIAWNSQALRRMTPVPASIAPLLERVIYPASLHEQLLAGIERAQAPSPTVAFVGRLEWQKAPDLAVRAVALLRDRHGIDSRLVIAGSGDRATVGELERLVAKLDMGDRVELRGQLPPQALAEMLAGADALVVPSRWQEPFGLVCLEGALARVPVVASRSGGMPEMLESDSEALFFPIDDADGCAAALARTLSDEAATARRVRAAFERAGTYSMRRYRAAYDAFVIDAMRASRSAPVSRT
jgi:glycosyltransferase involved in cell wall biosynthesis